MAHSNQAKKRIRQNERRRTANKAVASRMRTEIKRVLQACDGGDKAEAEKAMPTAMRCVDKAAKVRVLHPNTAARKKARLARAINGIGA